jgi:hypothetical protein
MITALLLSAAAARTGAGQTVFSAPAGAHSLQARGVDGSAWNPAVLAWDQRYELRFFSVNASARNNSFSIADYNRWNGGTWSESDKQEIISRIPESSLEGRCNAWACGPGFSLHRWAFSLENRAAGFLRAPREFARLVLNGNDPRESFDLGGAEGEGIAWSELRVSHARLVGRLPIGRGAGAVALGGSIRILRGWEYGAITDAAGGLSTSMDGISGDVSVAGRSAQGGSGFGLDLGAATRVTGWDFGLALRNLFTTIRWTDHARRDLHTATADNLELDSLDRADLVRTESRSEAIAPFRTGIPTELTLAAGRGLGGRAYVEADLDRGFAEGAGVSDRTRLDLGLRWPIMRAVQPRMGLSFGGADGTVCSAGLGLRWWKMRLDLTAASSGGLSSSAKGVSGGCSFGVAGD